MSATVTGEEAAVEVRSGPALPGRRKAGRLQFLDALRGIAAMAVVCQHGAEALWPREFRFSEMWFRPGEFGVVLFFLCSGFIIPASVERYSSLRRFWIGRTFRLFPLYWLALAAVLLTHVWLGSSLAAPDYFDHGHGVLNTIANATMLQEFLHVPLTVGQSWSLGFEMVFYAGTSVLFAAGLHKRNVPIAVGALVLAVVVGTAVPAVWLVNASGHRQLLGIAGCIVAAIVGASIVRSGVVGRLSAGVLLGVLVMLALNGPVELWFTVLLFATMTVGTVLYRFTTGEVRGRTAAAVYGLALVAIVAIYQLQTVPHLLPIAGAPDAVVTAHHPEVPTFLGAYLVFGAFLLLRNHTMPRPLVYLGTISYSLYLVHAIVYYNVPWWGADKPLTFARWLVAALVLSSLTYRFIEKPANELGRRLAKHGLRGALRARADAGERVQEHAAP
ncbi:MAG: acyltransferase [Mycobacterium sp.]|nr:acyltransferase [Mycobacterium sp.]